MPRALPHSDSRTSAALHGEDLRERVPAAGNMLLPSSVTVLEGYGLQVAPELTRFEAEMLQDTRRGLYVASSTLELLCPHSEVRA